MRPLLTVHSQIVDDNFKHALRLFKEKDSGGIRLQASVLSGELKRYSFVSSLCRYTFTLGRNPVWTAFITHQILSPKWIKQVSSKVIHLADLQRYIFHEEYKPQIAPSGEHELSFIKSSGMTAGIRDFYSC